jgi:hypothetical protein
MRLDSQVVVGSPSARAAYVLALTVLLALLVVGAAVAGASLLAPRPHLEPEPEHGAFSSAGRLAHARWAHTATLLPDGSVMVLGGATVTDLLTSSELWKPADGSFGPGASLGTARSSHTATLLPDGRILVVGGHRYGGPADSAEVWNPAEPSFAPTGSLAVSRTYHTATLLKDGRVLVVGGWGDVGQGSAATSTDVGTAQVWDPTTDSFSAAGSPFSRATTSATLLDDGRVLIVGDGAKRRGAAACFRRAVGTRRMVIQPATPPGIAPISRTATLLPDGRPDRRGGTEKVARRLRRAVDP